MKGALLRARMHQQFGRRQRRRSDFHPPHQRERIQRSQICQDAGAERGPVDGSGGDYAQPQGHRRAS